MNDQEYYQQLKETLDEAVKNSVNNVADIGRLNDLIIETNKRFSSTKNDAQPTFVFDKSKVVPCPEKCTFNWQQFHKDLDVALAHMIDEFDGFYPSKADLWDLVQYSFVKSGGNNNSMKSVGEVIASPQYQKRMKKPEYKQIIDQTKDFERATKK